MRPTRRVTAGQAAPGCVLVLAAGDARLLARTGPVPGHPALVCFTWNDGGTSVLPRSTVLVVLHAPA